MENYKYIYKHRRGTAEQWKNSEIIPEEAELIVELDEKNYKHKLKLGDGIHTYENLSYLTAGGEAVTQTLARTVSVTLYASAWEEVTCESDPNIGYYKQTLNIDGIASNSKVDLQPTADMIAIFQSKNLAFVTETVIENNIPTIICYSIGSTPSSDYTLQATVTEVEIDGNNIIGNTVSTIPNLDNYATKSFVEEEVEKLEPLITTTDRWSPSGIATALSEGRRVVLTKNDSEYGKLVFDNFVYLEGDNVVVAYTLSDQPDGVDMYVYSIYGYISSDEWLIVRSAYPTKTSQLHNDSGFITAEELESENYYYTTVSGAIADIEAGTTEHAIANTDEAYVKVFTSCDGTKTVMLLKDLLETAQISTTKNLNINLGGHTLTIDSSVAYIPFNSEIVCVSNGNIVIDITNGVQYASLITFWGNHVIMDNINLKVFGGTSQLIAGVYVTNNNGVYDIKNCKITVSNSLESAVAIYNNQGTLNIENTVIKTDTDSAKNSIGITNKSRLTIVDSTIFADAPDNSTDRNGLSIGIHNYGILYSTNTDVCGTHSGMQNEGNVCIYGGTYKSCSHGGLYLVANGKGKTLVKDATIACSDYTGSHDASVFTNEKLAALYLGSSSNSNGEIAYFDGCTIDATGADHVMVLRESNGDNLNVFNISNSTISDGENYIRMDGATVKLNIGVGTNITTDRLPSGANYEYTNEFYRKFGKDADIKGRDINLVLATCATKNELDKIPNQTISVLENNAIEKVYSKNLFNKNNYKALKAYVNSTGKILTSASEATTVYIPVEANQVYTVSKITSKRFAVGVTDSEMIANGTTFTETIQTNTATSITISTGANSKNLAVFCHVSSADTLTVEEILDTLQIEKGDTATEYEEWHEPTYNAVDKVARENISEAVETALTEAKESGEFNGTSVTITNISESTEDAGSNVVTFSDGNILTIQNGSQGVSGVYVGSGDMPEGYSIQIDPDGDIIDVADLKGDPGYTPQKGVDYWTEDDKEEIIAELTENETLINNVAELVKTEVPFVKTAEQPTFIDSVDKMTDTSKVYVMPDGFLYTYMQKATVTVGENHFIPSEAIINARLSGSSGSITENGSLGSVVTGFIAVTDWNTINPFEVSIDSVSNKGSDDNRVVFYDVNKTKLGYANIACSHDGVATPNGVWENGVETYNIKVDKSGNAVTITDVAYIRMQILVGTKGTAITDSDVANLQIKIAHETGTTTQTGFFSTGQAYNQPADYESEIVQLKKDVNSINEAIIDLQNSGGNDSDSDEVSVPTYWQSAVDSCIAKIKALQVGRHCLTFPFFSDNHTNTKDLGVLIAKVMKECHIPYCLFGGDAIDSGYLTESQMIRQDKAFDNAMSQIPNGRFCRAIGNHDGFWNDNGTKGYYTRAKVYELFLREEGLAQNKHFGEDGTYYYIDDIASKVRFIVLNTNSEVISAGGESIDSTQLSWLQNTALSFNEDGWGVVIISHCPISNHYHANVTNAEEVISVVNGADVDIIGWFSGHIHRDRMYTHLAVGSADGVEGTNGATLGFTQVVITSDHTGIAYDDTTKHPVANDDLSHAIDFVTINRNTRTVNLTRLGIGSDRSYTY